MENKTNLNSLLEAGDTLKSGYNVTESNEVISQLYGITPEIKQKLAEMSVKVMKKKNSAIKELNDLIKKYPFIPQFKNFLSSLYDMQGNQFMAIEINRRIVGLHPEYLFGRLNVANIAIAKNEFEKVPEILCASMELGVMYPERKEFHVSEVNGFLQTAFNYFIAIKDVEQAQMRLNNIEKLNKEFDLEIEMYNFNRAIHILKIETEEWNTEQYDDDDWVGDYTVSVIPKKVVEATKLAPTFTHELVQQLYCHDLRIDQEIIQEILLLPRETLIADLHKVLYDSIARYKYFEEETEWKNETHEFPFHAIFLLMELKSEDSLEVLFDLLRQDEAYIDYWINDCITEEFWQFIYVLGEDKLSLLRSFVFEPNRYLYSRSIMSNVVVQVGIRQPERRAEVIEWFQGVIAEIFERINDNTIIDDEWIAYLVSDIIDLEAIELIPQITQLFEKNLVALFISGGLKECLELINTPKGCDKTVKLPEHIVDWYNEMLTTWHNYKEEDDNGRYKPEYNQDKQLPVFSQKPNVGRNDPCPCGSGKKYKKCCL